MRDSRQPILKRDKVHSWLLNKFLGALWPLKTVVPFTTLQGHNPNEEITSKLRYLTLFNHLFCNKKSWDISNHLFVLAPPNLLVEVNTLHSIVWDKGNTVGPFKPSTLPRAHTYKTIPQMQCIQLLYIIKIQDHFCKLECYDTSKCPDFVQM